MEILNYLYPFVSTTYILNSLDHAVVYIFAGMWSVFNRLPFIFFIFVFIFSIFFSLQWLYSYLTKQQTRAGVSNLFLALILVFDFLALVSVIGIASALIQLRTLTTTSYLSVYYAPTISSEPIIFRDALAGLGELGLHFKMDIVAVVFIFIAVIVIDICLVVYEFRAFNLSIILFLLLKASAVSCFCAANLFTFTFFMEISSILTLFIVLSSAGIKKSVAGLYYFVYSSVSGFILIASTVCIIECSGSTTFQSLRDHLHPWDNVKPAATVFTFFIILALIVKIPSGPFYHWLLKAHVEASTSGSLILAAIMLKMPACGLLRIFILLEGEMQHMAFLIVSVFCAITMISCASQIWYESDLKRIVALSSIVHMSGFVVFVQTAELADGFFKIPMALLWLAAHSFASSTLFMVCGAISSRYHTRDFLQIAGLFSNAPALSNMFLLGALFAGGFPLGLVFTSEVYATSTVIYSQNWPVSIFILIIYSFVFLRFLLIYVFMLPGEAGGRNVRRDATAAEYFGVLCLVLVMTVIAFYSTEIASTLLLSIWPRLIPRQLRDFVVTCNLEYRRIRSLRSFRWGWGGMPREPERDFIFGIESKLVRQRRLVRYIRNALRFRDRFGFINTQKYDTAPIKPAPELPWLDLVRWIGSSNRRVFSYPFNAMYRVLERDQLPEQLEQLRWWARLEKLARGEPVEPVEIKPGDNPALYDFEKGAQNRERWFRGGQR